MIVPVRAEGAKMNRNFMKKQHRQRRMGEVTGYFNRGDAIKNMLQQLNVSVLIRSGTQSAPKGQYVFREREKMLNPSQLQQVIKRTSHSVVPSITQRRPSQEPP